MPSLLLISTIQHAHSRQSVKLNHPTLAAASDGSLISRRLFFNDRSSGYRYLVDTGADISVIPPSSGHCHKQSDRKLYAANGTCIDTYGECLLKLDLGLRRHFPCAPHTYSEKKHLYRISTGTKW
jgi:cleavage and polyadenylation specificity factor subunit 1